MPFCKDSETENLTTKYKKLREWEAGNRENLRELNKKWDCENRPITGALYKEICRMCNEVMPTVVTLSKSGNSRFPLSQKFYTISAKIKANYFINQKYIAVFVTNIFNLIKNLPLKT